MKRSTLLIWSHTMAEELKDKLRQAQEILTRLREGTDSVRTIVYDTRYGGVMYGYNRRFTISLHSLWEEAEQCVRRSQDLYNKIKDITTSIESETLPYTE